MLVTDFDEEEGLLVVLDDHAVMTLKVLSDRYLFVLELEGLRNGVAIEVDFTHDVGPLVSPVRNY